MENPVDDLLESQEWQLFMSMIAAFFSLTIAIFFRSAALAEARRAEYEAAKIAWRHHREPKSETNAQPTPAPVNVPAPAMQRRRSGGLLPQGYRPPQHIGPTILERPWKALEGDDQAEDASGGKGGKTLDFLGEDAEPVKESTAPAAEGRR